MAVLCNHVNGGALLFLLFISNVLTDILQWLPKPNRYVKKHSFDFFFYPFKIPSQEGTIFS